MIPAAKRWLAVSLAYCACRMAWGFYGPEMGRWTTRDPIEENDSLNLYAFVGNNTIARIDPFGMYTLGDAEDSLTRKKAPKMEHRWYGDRYSDTQIFEEWLALERTRGAWWSSLPRCPSKLCIKKDGTPVNPDPKVWNEPSKNSLFLGRYHPGGEIEMRSLPVGNHATQCVYDKNGNLMAGPPSGGTVDWRHTGPDYFFGHGPHDVETYKLAEKLNRINDYYSVRPSW